MSVRRRNVATRLARELAEEKSHHQTTRGLLEARGRGLDEASERITMHMRANVKLASEKAALRRKFEELHRAVCAWSARSSDTREPNITELNKILAMHNPFDPHVVQVAPKHPRVEGFRNDDIDRLLYPDRGLGAPTK